MLEIEGLWGANPSRVLAAPFDRDIPKGTYLTEYAGILMGRKSVRELEATRPEHALWVRWLMRDNLYVNGVPVDFEAMANENRLASIADHSYTPNCTLTVKTNWVSQHTGVSPSLILQSKQHIKRSTRERLSFLTFYYGPAEETSKHGIIRGVCSPLHSYIISLMHFYGGFTPRKTALDVLMHNTVHSAT